MPGCNPAFRPDKKLDVNEIRMLTIFITSPLTRPMPCHPDQVKRCRVSGQTRPDSRWGVKKPPNGRLWYCGFLRRITRCCLRVRHSVRVCGPGVCRVRRSHENGFFAEHGLAQEAVGEQHEFGVGAEDILHFVPGDFVGLVERAAARLLAHAPFPVVAAGALQLILIYNSSPGESSRPQPGVSTSPVIQLMGRKKSYGRISPAQGNCADLTRMALT